MEATGSDTLSCGSRSSCGHGELARDVRPLDETGCWLRIAGGAEGRLKIRTGTGDRSVVTRYLPLVAEATAGIVLAIPSHSSAFQYALGRRVILEIDGRDDNGGTWVVRLSGLARVLHERYLPPHAEWDDQHWSVSRIWRYLYVPADQVAGTVDRAYSVRRKPAPNTAA